MESLTIRENISFSANLRRSFKSSDERKSIVNRVIEELGLTSCADSLVSCIALAWGYLWRTPR